jgi:hypothetical protein
MMRQLALVALICGVVLGAPAAMLTELQPAQSSVAAASTISRAGTTVSNAQLSVPGTSQSETVTKPATDTSAVTSTATGIPVQLLIVWSLLVPLAGALSFAIVHSARRRAEWVVVSR